MQTLTLTADDVIAAFEAQAVTHVEIAREPLGAATLVDGDETYGQIPPEELDKLYHTYLRTAPSGFQPHDCLYAMVRRGQP